MTYAANIENLKPSEGKYTLVKADICDLEKNIETLKNMKLMLLFTLQLNHMLIIV